MTVAVSASGRALGRGAVVLAVLLGVLLGGAAPASAHPTLLFTDPAADTAVPDTPPAITLVFNEAVTTGPDALTVLDDEGRALPMGETTTAKDGHLVTGRPAQTLPPGVYLVRWRAVGTDGDLVEQEFRFAVGAAITGGPGTTGPSISWSDAALRWLLFAGVAVALGALVGERFTASALAVKPTLPPLRSWVLPAVLTALAGVLGLAALLIAATGDLTALWQGRAGLLLTVEAFGLLLTVGVTTGGRPRWAVAPLLLVVAAEGLRSHTNVAAPGWGAALTGVHLAAAAVWAGALLHVVRAGLAWRGDGPAVRWVLAGYARLAIWVFLVVITTGTVTALLLVPLTDLLNTGYGRVLLIKLILVAVAAGLALAGRLALRRTGGATRIRTATRIESGVLVAVLAVSAVLVSTPPAANGQPAAPPPRGQVLPLGALAGQIGVSVAASDGQLVVRLSTPSRGNEYDPQPAQDYTLSGQLAGAAGGSGDPVDFRGCGKGCFVAQTPWEDGDNVLTLQAQAPGWRPGTVSLLVPWPTQPGGDDLTRAVAALRAAGRVTVYETVTSDTAAAGGDPTRLDIDAGFFLAQEPYATGVAPIASRISRAGQPVRLALGYPAASINVLLTLDQAGRISEETLTDDTHLIHRRFVYPDPG